VYLGVACAKGLVPFDPANIVFMQRARWVDVSAYTTHFRSSLTYTLLFVMGVGPSGAASAGTGLRCGRGLLRGRSPTVYGNNKGCITKVQSRGWDGDLRGSAHGTSAERGTT